jgi:O-antigen biosynthesis protein
MTLLTLPRRDDPTLSVVMVTYGGWEWVLKSLTALVERTDPVYEVILIDNDSPDGTGDRIRDEVKGATLVLNDRNAGFGPAANQGAGLASGRFLCFLNPDALVQPGWLPPMVDVLDSDPLAGAVVPQLVNLDGALQEAGSLVGFDGSTWALGNGDDPNDPQYRFRRYVDFGSAACLLMPRSLFLEIGGFHPAYVPAYCEDVDLCLTLAERGLRTVYEPRSVVRHARSASTDPERAQTLIERNRRILHHRWKDKLAQRPWLDDLPFYPHRIVAARDAEEVDRILLILDRVPSEDPRDPVSRFVYETAGLWPTARITLLANDGNGEVLEKEAQPLRDLGVEVITRVDDWQDWFARRRYHYSVVIVQESANVDRVSEVISETQPQSIRVEAEVLMPRDGSEQNDHEFRRSLIDAMSNLGIEPPEQEASGPRPAEAVLR